MCGFLRANKPRESLTRRGQVKLSPTREGTEQLEDHSSISATCYTIRHPRGDVAAVAGCTVHLTRAPQAITQQPLDLGFLGLVVQVVMVDFVVTVVVVMVVSGVVEVSGAMVIVVWGVEVIVVFVLVLRLLVVVVEVEVLVVLVLGVKVLGDMGRTIEGGQE